MHKQLKAIQQALAAGLLWLSAVAALAGPVYQPAGANLTYGDVTHGQRVQSASSNPAAAAADLARGTAKTTRGTVLSGAAGLEYGNVQNLFDFYDKVTGAYEPSDPGDDGGGPGRIRATSLTAVSTLAIYGIHSIRISRPRSRRSPKRWPRKRRCWR
ncbi:MAG: hypothetical protein IIA09_12000 [Proteobacteria bacterium]|nr:hypothetical protein [Pseudomonadota bacterium]